MIKLIGSVLVLCGCVLLGFRAYDRLAARVKLIAGLVPALELISAEICFRLAPLDFAVAAALSAAEKPAKDFLSNCAASLNVHGSDNFQHVWSNAVEDYRTVMGNQAAETLLELAPVLGKYGADEQKTVLDYALLRLKRALTDAEDEKRRSGKICVTLGFCGGLTLAIVLL